MKWYELSFLVGTIFIVVGIVAAGAGWIKMQRLSWDRLKQVESVRFENVWTTSKSKKAE